MSKKNPQLLILIGAPGSGKSTFAKYHLRTHLNWMRLCRDDFRQMHFTHSFLPDKEEKMITIMIDAAVSALLASRTNVIIDATHTKKEYLDYYVHKFSHIADIQFKVFEAPLSVLLQRCEERFRNSGKHIPASAIQKHVENLEVLKREFDFSVRSKTEKTNQYVAQDIQLPKAVICDLDGTLALLNGRDPYDASNSHDDVLNEPVANVLRNYQRLGYKIILLSGREDRYEKPTLRFIEQHGIVFDKLLMRKSGDSRKDSLVKKELYQNELKGKYYVEFILDDRNQVVNMWRDELRLPCFQVYYGDF